MEAIDQSSALIGRMHPLYTEHNRRTGMQFKSDTKNSSFTLKDSSETDLSLFVSPAKTDDAAMFFIDKGVVTLALGMKKYKLTEGMLFLKVPKVSVQLLSFSEDCHFKVFEFAPHFAIGKGMPITHFENITLIASNNPVLTMDNLSATTISILFWLLQKKGYSVENEHSHDETIQHVFSLLILEITSTIKRTAPDNPCQFSRKAHLSSHFLKLLREYIKEQRSVNFYADQLYVTPKHLSSCVKIITGKTCGEIIDEMVVAEAKTLLHNPELSIGHVADQLNFSDQYFFSKYFKKHTGLSPLHYRMAG